MKFASARYAMSADDSSSMSSEPVGDLESGPEAAPDAMEASEITELLNIVYESCGVDFRDYAYASLLRRIRRRMSEEGVDDIRALRRLAGSDDACMQRLLNSLTLPVTSMFRDPSFFKLFRERICPVLATYPYLRIWVAGCSTGQEAYSLAILLSEAGLYERSRIYATDLHAGAVQQAEAGIYQLSAMQEYSRQYQEAGGTRSFSEYFVADDEYAALNPELRRNMVFATHNLVSDSSFNEFHVIFCRNVMIYFNDKLQQRVHGLLYASLGMFGFLGLGRSESIRFSYHEGAYETVSKAERMYRKVK
ncbi:MAG TPA: protein-glutamate O-methyltransferase CheR [Steroidobacteraceae bacterium]|nr:protein-glutamate O-methyltransferase CheR [Steroidobacteraceae bacterium]